MQPGVLSTLLFILPAPAPAFDTKTAFTRQFSHQFYPVVRLQHLVRIPCHRTQARVAVPREWGMQETKLKESEQGDIRIRTHTSYISNSDMEEVAEV